MAALVSVLMLSACADDRPSDVAWRATWQREREIVPDADTLVAGGQGLCDDLVAQLRSARDELTPTPTEALDDAVDAWIGHAETLVFECSLDADVLAARMAELDVLAAEIDAGLAADQGRT